MLFYFIFASENDLTLNVYQTAGGVVFSLEDAGMSYETLMVVFFWFWFMAHFFPPRKLNAITEVISLLKTCRFRVCCMPAVE